jgi:hypothetical protein
LLVFRQIDAAKAKECLATGFKGSEAARYVFLDGHFEVGGDFRFEVGVERGLVKEGLYAGEGSPQWAG